MEITDKQTVDLLIAGDTPTIKDFFFVRCRPMLIYIGRYFCHQVSSPEELIGEFYEFLSANDWHKLRIFKYTCSLRSYVTIIASRYFQHKRDMQLMSLDACLKLTVNLQEGERDMFFMGDLRKVMNGMCLFDRFLVQRILLDGEKPRDIVQEAWEVLAEDPTVSTDADTDTKFAAYIHTRYNRIRKGLKKHMSAVGYGN